MSWLAILNLSLIALLLLGLVIAALRASLSGKALRHSVDRHFGRMPDGRLVFYPWPKGTGYIVPSAEREQVLRVYARRRQAVSFGFGALILPLLFCLTPVVWPVIAWLHVRAGISTGVAIYVCSFALVLVIFAVMLGALLLWSRLATRGLAKSVEESDRPGADGRLDHLILDMPVAVRWLALLVCVYLFILSLRGLWMAWEVSDWFNVGSSVCAIALFGWLLWHAPRMRKAGL